MTQPPPAGDADARPVPDRPQQPDDDDPALARQHEEWAAEDGILGANPTALGE